MTDSEDQAKNASVWKVEITREDGEVDTSELVVPSKTDEPFNHDGFWKAVFLEPDGELRWLPVIAVTCDVVEAPPHWFVWVNDTVVDCDDRRGFIGVVGTERDMDEGLRHPTEEWLGRIARWGEFYERERERRRASAGRGRAGGDG